MKKIYLKNNNGNLQPSRIMDADTLSFVFNRVDGSVFATQSATSKTSEIKIIQHPDWKHVPVVDRYLFETEVMDKLSTALIRLYNGDGYILEIDFDCSEVHIEYTFRVDSFGVLTNEYVEEYRDTLKISIGE